MAEPACAMRPDEFVDKLFLNAGISPSATDRDSHQRVWLGEYVSRFSGTRSSFATRGGELGARTEGVQSSFCADAVLRISEKEPKTTRQSQTIEATTSG